MSAIHSVRQNAVALCNLIRSLSSADASTDEQRRMLDQVDPHALARGITSDYVKLLVFLLGGFSSQVSAFLAPYNLGSVEGDDGRFLAKVYSLSVKALKVNIKVGTYAHHVNPLHSHLDLHSCVCHRAWPALAASLLLSLTCPSCLCPCAPLPV